MCQIDFVRRQVGPFQFDMVRTGSKFGSRKLCIEKGPSVAHDCIGFFGLLLFGWNSWDKVRNFNFDEGGDAYPQAIL